MRANIIGGCTFIILCLILFPLEAKQQNFEQAPQVKPEKKPEGGLEPHSDAKKFDSALLLKLALLIPKEETGKDNQISIIETRTEPSYWPSIFGYRVKVTDSLLVLFTFCCGSQHESL
jgi:hypothetical protein